MKKNVGGERKGAEEEREREREREREKERERVNKIQEGRKGEEKVNKNECIK